MSRFTLPALLTAAALAVGCAGSVYSDGYGYGYYDDVYTPDLLSISPGVSVVAGYHDPVFYSNNYYWRYDDYGRWARSPYYNRGWVYATPPYSVRSINRPYAYRNYRPYGYTVRRDPYYRGGYGRDYNRGYRGTPYRGYDRGYRGTPQTRHYDRGYRGTPQTRSYDRGYRGTPQTRSYDRGYRGTPNSRTVDRTYRGQPVRR
jgi:hypothetical protein